MSKSRAFLLAIAIFFPGLLLTPPVLADHPEAEKLLPEKTMVLVKIKNVRDFTNSFTQTGFARMLQDEKMLPVTESLYGSLEDLYGQIEDQLGVSLNQLLTLFQGEVCFGLVMEKDEPITLVILADYKGNSETTNQLLKVGETRAEESGAKLESEDLDDVVIRTIDGGGSDERVHYFQKNDSICATNNLEMAKRILAKWKQEIGEEVSADLKEELGEKLEIRPLSKNRKFLNVINACDPDENNPQQAFFFVDVFEIIKNSQQGIAGTAIVGILRGLGVDGLLGIGGSMTNQHEDYESIIHLHIALANPRAGLIKMIALEPGDLTPEPIFPSNVSNYFTTNWNTVTSYNEIEKIYDMFNGEGALKEELTENFTDRFGIDLKEDILESLEGRLSFGQVNVESGPLNGQATILSAKLKNPREFEEIFADLRAGIEEAAGQRNRQGDDDSKRRPREGNSDRKIFTAEKYRGVEYFVLPGPPTQEEMERRRQEREDQLRAAGQEVPERRRRVQFQVRRAVPCIGIVGDYLVFTDSADFMKKAIENEKNPDDVLADDPDYNKLLREIKRQLDGKKPAMITFQRPEESIQMLYDAIKDEQTQSAIKDRMEDNPFFEALNKAFIENKLPEFDDLRKYFKPAAGVMTNDETGFHFMSFQPKIDEDE